MIQPIGEQLRLTWMALLTGFGLGVLYRLPDAVLFGRQRNRCRGRRPLTAGMLLRRLAADLGFCTVCLGAVLIFALVPCGGALRLYHIVSMGLGGVLPGCMGRIFRRNT